MSVVENPGSSVASRRGFLALCLACLGALTAGRARADSKPERFVGIFRNPGTARRLGRAYLSAYPAEADPEQLLALLLDGEAMPHRQSDLEALIAHRRQADFSEGRVTLVAGTVLSRSEARACALAAAE